MKKITIPAIGSVVLLVLNVIPAFAADNGSTSTSFTTSVSLSNASQTLAGDLSSASIQPIPGTVTNGVTQVANAGSFTCNGTVISSGNGIQVQQDAAGTYNVDLTNQSAVGALQKDFPSTVSTLLSGSDRFGSGGTSMNQALLPCQAAITVPTSTADQFRQGSVINYTVYTFHLTNGYNRKNQTVSNANSLLNGVYTTSTTGSVSSTTGQRQFCTGMPPILATTANDTITQLANGVYQLEVPSGSSADVNYQCAGLWKINRTDHYVNGTNKTQVYDPAKQVLANTLFSALPYPANQPQQKAYSGGLVIIK